jgi:outer membrane protein assembly factor BamB
MRSVTVANGDNAASPAGTLARAGVADLIQRCGIAIYSIYEQKAQAAMVMAADLPDAAKAPQLVAIAEMYPNSKAAIAAMLSAADAYESSGNPRELAALMRQFCSRYPDSPDRARAIESLARAYLEMPNRVDGLNVAIGRLDQGANLAGNQRLSRPLKLPDGTQIENVTFAQAADALRNFQAKIATKALPDPGIPVFVKPVRGQKRAELLPEDPSAALTDVSDLILPLHDWARHDRIVTFSSSGGLAVYAVGSNQPLFTCSAVTESPRNVAWIGGNLLVWCPSRLLLVRGEATTDAATTVPSVAEGDVHGGEVIWDSPLHTLPAAQFASVGTNPDEDDGTATAAAGDDADPTQQPPVEGTVTINGQRITIRGNGRVIVGRGGQLQIVGGRMGGAVVIRGGIGGGFGGGFAGGLGGGFGGGAVAGINQPNVLPNPNGDNIVEQIDRLVPTGDRLVFSTTGGETSSRVVCLNLSDGKVQWQTSLEDHQIDQLAANDDFVVIRATNDTEMRLVAFDGLTGQPVWRPRPFGRENNDADVPINLCLAEDGSLVYLTADHICCKDLFDPTPTLRFDRPVMRNNNNALNGIPNAGMPSNTFPGATAPDQLVVSDGRVMAVSDNGTFVRVYSLADGKPYDRGPDGKSILDTEVTNSPWNVHLRVVGTKLYIFGPDKVLHYDLDNVDDFWPQSLETSIGKGGTTITIRDLILTKQDVVVLLEPASAQHSDPGSAYSPNLRIRAYSRAILPNGHETGSLKNDDRVLTETTDIKELQVVDGGIYYASADHKVHFLKGGSADDAK